jgi:iron complex outermembrane receptor protein
MKNYNLALIISALLTISIYAEEVEEVVVTASLTNQTVSDLKDPLHVVDGDDVDAGGVQSLGDTLDELLGVHSADFGAAVGQPVVRGMSGSRVRVLENGVVVRDVAALGPDHINDVNLLNTQQIEVVKGPSSLLYANGGAGGVINIVDNSIATTDLSSFPMVAVGAEVQSVNNGEVADFSYAQNLSGFNVTFVTSDSFFENYELPAGALYPEEHHDEDHHDSEGDEEHEGESMKMLANSDVENSYSKIGISRTGDWGYVGVSFSDNEGVMGVPFHVEAHGHEDDDHSESEDEHDEHEEERIFSQIDSNKFDIKGSINTDGYALVNKIDFSFRDSSYEHLEGHAEEEGHHDDDHSESEEDGHGHEEPTLFETDATEFGLIFDVSSGDLTRKIVFNKAEQDSSIIGEEAFMRPVSTDETTFGYFVSRDFGNYRYDLGIRADEISRSGSVAHHDEDHAEDEEGEIEFYNQDISTLSVALNFDQDFSENLSVNLGLSSFERAPDVVELFMNGPHLATGRFEVGNPNLDTETSNNVDLTFNYQKDNMYATFAYYQNSVSNYIYLKDEEHDEDHHDSEGEEEHEGLMHAEFVQEDASLEGYEFEVGTTYQLLNGTLDLSFGRDVVEGTLDAGGFIPRMAPSRNFISASYTSADYNLSAVLKDVADHEDVADENETMTEGYKMLNLRLTKDYTIAGANLKVSAFANNALDQVARNSTSFVKDAVPLPGRNIGLSLRLSY